MNRSGPTPLPDWATSLGQALQPPAWAVAEAQNRIVLALNHVLMQEPQAAERLKRHLGKTVRAEWGAFSLDLRPTAAGLLELAPPGGTPDLRASVAVEPPLDMARRVLGGQRPAIDIQGEVQLASDVAWLVDNLRWDVEEDLSRVFGDAVAHTLVQQTQAMAQAVRAFVARWTPMAPAARPSPSPDTPSDLDQG